MNTRRTGFTLIEITAVVIIVGLLAGAVAVTFARPVGKVREREAAELIRISDSWAREYAKRFGRDVTIAYDISRGEVRREADRPLASRMPSGIRLAEVWTTQRRISGGIAEIAVSSCGLSRTYAVRLVGPESERWLIVAGLSGQVTEAAHESEVADILRGTSARPEPR